MEKDYKFLNKHKVELKSGLESIKDKPWSLEFPIFIFDRCWFKLNKIKIMDLYRNLKPDNSEEAPELIRYKQLINEGIDSIIAVQQCWHEYGMEDFHLALRKSWDWKGRGNNGWTFKTYINLITKYRSLIESSNTSIPLIILARSSNDIHKIEWITQEIILSI